MHDWIIDSGPPIHLEQIGHLNLLKHLFRLVMPASVEQELTRHMSSASYRAFAHWPNVSIISAIKPPNHADHILIKKAHLHPGETDCLAIALEKRPSIFLTDALAARTAAEQLHIEVHGTVGLIGYGVKRKWLPLSKAEEALRSLYDQSRFFVTPVIIKRAIQKLQDLT